ncbi:uncharacterized protein LOC135385774 [Ornithodoros turicata]|uniref:uncharacterized protein LOC135385774 n=1 Tax=Ornithodoros turicata TaxID=34597 RepID=UPI0031398E07
MIALRVYPCVVLIHFFTLAVLQGQDTGVTEIVDVLFTKKLCNRIKCLPVQKCTEGFLDDSGCCPVCRGVAKDGEPCWNVPVLFDGSPSSRCAVGLVCKGGVCVESYHEGHSFDMCEAKRRRRLLLQTEGLISQEAWIPECDPLGNYIAKQCKRHKCVCVDDAGRTIFGQAPLEMAENMTCACARKMASIMGSNLSTWMVEPQIHCDTQGNFKELQCQGVLCYCADPKTGEPQGMVVSIKQLNLLPCYDAKKGDYLSACEKETVRIRRLIHDFGRKGQTLVGIESPACDIDGSFASVQCSHPDKCVCSSREGSSLKSYAHAFKERATRGEMDCNCALDEYDIERQLVQLPHWSCDQYGNYDRVQCVLDRCYCIESDGSILQSFPYEKDLGAGQQERDKLQQRCAATDVSLYCSVERFAHDTICTT